MKPNGEKSRLIARVAELEAENRRLRVAITALVSGQTLSRAEGGPVKPGVYLVGESASDTMKSFLKSPAGEGAVGEVLNRLGVKS